MIELKSVSYSYPLGQGRKLALKDISLTIGRGEFVAIVGSNGSGKSTLAKILSGLFTPSGGELIVGAFSTANPENIWQIRQAVGMIFQNPESQIVGVTVEDDVAFGPENLGLSSKEIVKRVKEALRLVSLIGKERFEPHLLSGGEKQRLAVAGVLAMRPSCLVLDEPTSMLDPKGRRELLEILASECAGQGRTIILITHRMDEACLAKRVIALDKGSIVADLSTRDFFSSFQLLERLGLDPPFAVALKNDLIRAGLNLPNILTSAELIEAICSLS